jgi:hypothetical protein
MASDEIIPIVDARGLGPVEHGRKLPEIVVQAPSHGSVSNPTVVEEHGPDIQLEE